MRPSLTAHCVGLCLGVLLALAAAASVAAQEGTRSPAAAGTAPWLGMNLAVAADWSTQDPFIDKMRLGRRWIGHLPGQWGGWDHDDLRAAGVLDAEGWPTRIPPELEGISTLVLTDIPADAAVMAGRYHLAYDGTGRVEISGRAENVIPGRGRAAGQSTFDYTPGEGLVMLTIRASDPDDPVRNITVVHERHRDAVERGEIFNPDWTARLDGVRLLRFMNWGATNNSTLARWEDRPQLDDYSWQGTGIPLEVMIRLANELQADPWFTLPHLADDDFIRHFAETVRDMLDPGLRAHIELSNEVWNWQFTQARWAADAAEARWGDENQWLQYYARRAAQMVMIWDDVFAGQHERLVRVLATQAGWPGLEEQLQAPLWQAEDPANPAPPELFDAYAITGYFDGGLGRDPKVDTVRDWLAESQARAEADAQALPEADRAAHVAAHRFDHAVDLAVAELRDGAVTGDPVGSLQWLRDRVFPHHAAVARRWGLDLIMYEGGSHVVGTWPHNEDAALTAFFTHLNYTPELAALYAPLLRAWYDAGGDLFTAYHDVSRPGPHGSWGHLRHNADQNPRWEALVTFELQGAAP